MYEKERECVCGGGVGAYRSKEMLLGDKFLIAHMSDAVRTALLWKKGMEIIMRHRLSLEKCVIRNLQRMQSQCKYI